MKKIFVYILTAVFFAAMPYDAAEAHTKGKKSVKSAPAKIAPAKRKLKKKAPPLSSEEQLRKDLQSRLSKVFPKDEIEKIFSGDGLAVDKSVFDTKSFECELPDGTKRNHTGFYDPVCGILTSASLQRGKDFIEKYQETFDRADELYGVDAEVIAAILRVETNFGSYIGKHSVLNALYTQYVFTPSRRSMALEQIEFFLRLAKKQEWDLFAIKGSTWGAIGLPQFMPFSYWHFAVDCGGDGKADLFDPADAICSAANYLRIHGWSDKLKNQRSAIWAYNHDNTYVNAVLAYAKALKNLKSD
ncbi:MAG: lytic murein transglycosylase [bacterium]|nr:lytic murein transglycosylase [bacterium]